MNRLITFAEALNEALRGEMERDENIFVIGEDIGPLGGRAGVTKGLLKKFGSRRVIDAPLNEELFVGIAIGAAQSGLRPVVEFAHGSLITLAAADIFRAGIWRWICGNRFSLPIVIRVKTGDGPGPELGTSVISMFINLLGVDVVAPSTPYQAKGILKFSLNYDKPVIILENERLYLEAGFVPLSDYTFPIGRGEFRQRGTDISIITYSWLTNLAQSAVQQLADKKRIKVDVLDLVSLKPLDFKKIIDTSRKTKRVIILGDEPVGPTGIFANLYTIIKEEVPKAKICFVGTKNLPVPFGHLKQYVLPNRDEIIKNMISLLQN